MEVTKPTVTRRFSRTIPALAAALTFIIIFPTTTLAAPLSPLDPASPAVRSIANLHNIILVIATGVCLIVCGLLIASIVRVRRNAPDDPELDDSFRGSVILETIWTVIPVGILLLLLVLTFQAL